MNTPKVTLADQLLLLLKSEQSLSAAQLQAATGKSQASLSLALKRLGAQVHKLGAARSTRYALTQDILGLPASQDLFWGGGGAGCSGSGGGSGGSGATLQRFGTLTFLHQAALHVRSGQHDWLTQGRLPWFLTSLQPQGFLGRELARVRPDFPSDPEDWTLAQVLYMAINHVSDPVGAFFFRSPQPVRPPTPNDQAPKPVRYEELATNVGARLPAGSSAAGEQPKFTAHTNGEQSSIVKFSPPRGTPFGERWHHLLHLEKRALQTLGSNGIASAQTEIIETAKRCCLESRRFDRAAGGVMRHTVTAAAVHDEFVQAQRVNWVVTCEALVKQNLMSSGDARTVVLTYLFGQFIGNTDMHFGNLSFFVDDVNKPLFVPTPVYDMLPMMWRPDIHSGNLEPSPLREPVPPVGYAAEVALARAWAIDYWRQAGVDAELGSELRGLCVENARRLQHGFD